MNNFSYKKYFSKKFSGGFMMVEVLVAVSIIVVAVLAFMNVAQKSLYLSRQSLHTTQAEFLLEEGAEAVRTIRDNGWSGISGLSSGTTYYPTFSGGSWTLSNTPNSIGIFTRTVTVSNVNRDDSSNDISVSGTEDSGTKYFTVNISWQEGGSIINKTVSFYLTDLFS